VGATSLLERVLKEVLKKFNLLSVNL